MLILPVMFDNLDQRPLGSRPTILHQASSSVALPRSPSPPSLVTGEMGIINLLRGTVNELNATTTSLSIPREVLKFLKVIVMMVSLGLLDGM